MVELLLCVTIGLQIAVIIIESCNSVALGKMEERLDEEETTFPEVFPSS